MTTQGARDAAARGNASGQDRLPLGNGHASAGLRAVLTAASGCCDADASGVAAGAPLTTRFGLVDLPPGVRDGPGDFLGAFLGVEAFADDASGPGETFAASALPR